MSRLCTSIALVLLAASTVAAQDSRPAPQESRPATRPNPAAAAVFRKMTAGLYRPIVHGDGSVLRFKATSTVVRGDLTQTFGPYEIAWEAGKQAAATNLDGTAAAIPPAFVKRIVEDILGVHSFEYLAAHPMKLEPDGSLRFQLPATTPASPVLSVVLEPDKLGRLAEERHYGVDGKVLVRHRYRYEQYGKLWCIKAQETSGIQSLIKRWVYRDQGARRFPGSVTVEAGAVSESVVFSDIRVKVPGE